MISCGPHGNPCLCGSHFHHDQKYTMEQWGVFVSLCVYKGKSSKKHIYFTIITSFYKVTTQDIVDEVVTEESDM